jgi:hypothetical protein
MPSNIIIFPSFLVPQPLRRPNIVFQYEAFTSKLEVLFSAAILLNNQLLIAPQSGCTNYEILGVTDPTCTVQYTDCSTGVVTQLVVPLGEYRYRCARPGSISDVSGVSITQSLGACYPKVQIFSGLTVNNFLSVGGVQDLNGTGDWIGPGTNITGAQGAQGPQGAQGVQGTQGGGQPIIYGPFDYLWTLLTPPGSGAVTTNNGSARTGVISYLINDTDGDAVNHDALYDSVATGKWRLGVTTETGNSYIFTVTSVVDNGAYHTFGVTFLSGSANANPT